jgi:hypothetical protein
MKKTAVEWLEEQLINNKELISLDFQQAKEMEREQIIKTARYYIHERGRLTPKQYYNETFKSE